MLNAIEDTAPPDGDGGTARSSTGCYAMSVNPSLGCDIFKQLVGSDWILLRERGAYNCVYDCLPQHADDVLWAIERMIDDAESKEAQENGAKLACLAAFKTSKAHALRDACVTAQLASLRKGAAAVYSRNWADADIGEECRKRLGTLLNDEDTEVRSEAAKFLRTLSDVQLREFSEFIGEWTQSKSLEEGADSAARALEKQPIANPELTLMVAERIIEAIGGELTDFRTRHGGITFSLTPAILNVYQQSIDQRVRNWAIDLFEKLEELECPEIRTAMEAVDRI